MFLSKIKFFSFLTENEQKELEQSGVVRQKTFEKNSIVFLAGDTTDEIGVLSSGKVLIENNDPWGNRSLISVILEGNVFAESYALSGEKLMVDAIAAQKSNIIFLSVKKLSILNEKLKNTIYAELLQASVKKNLNLSARMFCTSPKKIRARMLTFLSHEYIRYGTAKFDIPYNRQQLADYINVERSALSKELAKMKDDGILDYRKNTFILKNLPV